MNRKNEWMIAASMVVSLASLGAARASEAQSKDCAVVSVQRSDVKADYTAGSAGQAGVNLGRGQLVGTGVTSRAAASMMIQPDPVSPDAGGASNERMAERAAKDVTPSPQVSRR